MFLPETIHDSIYSKTKSRQFRVQRNPFINHKKERETGIHSGNLKKGWRRRWSKVQTSAFLENSTRFIAWKNAHKLSQPSRPGGQTASSFLLTLIPTEQEQVFRVPVPVAMLLNGALFYPANTAQSFCLKLRTRRRLDGLTKEKENERNGGVQPILVWASAVCFLCPNSVPVHSSLPPSIA